MVIVVTDAMRLPVSSFLQSAFSPLPMVMLQHRAAAWGCFCVKVLPAFSGVHNPPGGWHVTLPALTENPNSLFYVMGAL